MARLSEAEQERAEELLRYRGRHIILSRDPFETFIMRACHPDIEVVPHSLMDDLILGFFEHYLQDALAPRWRAASKRISFIKSADDTLTEGYTILMRALQQIEVFLLPSFEYRFELRGDAIHIYGRPR